MTTKRRNFTNKFKAMVALAAIKEQNTERHHQGIDNEIPERKYENNKLLIRTHEAA